MLFLPLSSIAKQRIHQTLNYGDHAAYGSREWKLDKFLSGSFTYGYLALGEGMPFMEHSKKPMQQALRAGDAEVLAFAVNEGISNLARVPRPDTREHDSFPSSHATAAFAMATIQSQFHPKQSLWWYLGASAISVSRVRLYRHHITDILAGAALGFLTARLELSQPRGLLANPFILNPTRELQLKSMESKHSQWTYLADPLQHRYGIAYSYQMN